MKKWGKQDAFYRDSHNNCGGKLASSLCPHILGVQPSDNLRLFDILSKAL